MGPHKAKKRKRHEHADPTAVDTSKPTAVFTPKEGRAYTVSVALPGSIISNAQSHDLKTTLAGQIARALAVFCVDEVVIFDDGQSKPQRNPNYRGWSQEEHHAEHDSPEQAYTGYSDPDGFLIHILSYLETPPHLRKFLFPMHPNLRTAGTLPSLDMPHHLRAHEWCQYREGVTVETPVSATTTASTNGTSGGNPQQAKKRKKTNPQSPATSPLLPSPTSTLIETGLPQKTLLPISIPPNTRVTLKYPSATPPPSSSTSSEPLTAIAVSPDAPREEAGYCWGYQIRRAPSLSAVFTESTYDGGYDVTIGTSERGVPLSSILDPGPSSSSPASAKGDTGARPEPRLPIPNFEHLLIVFGGVAGLEVAVKADEELVGMGVTEPEGLFDYWVDLCPGQGSRTIRTEEAVWIGLMGLRGVVVGNGGR